MPVFVYAYVSPGVSPGYVNDYADIISDATEQQINQELQQFEASTTIEVVVATVPSLNGDDVAPFANTLFREWGIGKKETNNGVLLLIAPHERKLRIEVGYGLEGVLTDLQSGFIIDNIITPEFKANNYDSGIMNGVDAILQVVKGEQLDIPLSETYDVNMGPGDLFAILVVILSGVVPWIGAVMSRSKSWWFGGILGAIAGYALGWFFEMWEVIFAVLFGVIGLLFDRAISKSYENHVTNGTKVPWYAGGGSGGFSNSSRSGGGFGGFGGGSSGGGGASGSW